MPYEFKFQLLLRLSKNWQKNSWRTRCGGVAVRHLACSTLGKPKKPNFWILCELTENFMKDPVWWWCGLVWCGVTVFCDNNTYPSLGLQLRLWLGCGKYKFCQQKTHFLRTLFTCITIINIAKFNKKQTLQFKSKKQRFCKTRRRRLISHFYTRGW